MIRQNNVENTDSWDTQRTQMTVRTVSVSPDQLLHHYMYSLCVEKNVSEEHF
jgi:hypothetical protein